MVVGIAYEGTCPLTARERFVVAVSSSSLLETSELVYGVRTVPRQMEPAS